jgi:hypothetical protein
MNITEKHPTSQDHREGVLAKTIEKQTAKLPSDSFLWLALGSIAASLTLKISGRQKDALFVGQWAPTFLVLGVYNKLVKQLGSDRAEKGVMIPTEPGASQPPLEVLIMTLTFNSDKRMAFGTNHMCVAGEFLWRSVERSLPLDARSARFARPMPLGCFRSRCFFAFPSRQIDPARNCGAAHSARCRRLPTKRGKALRFRRRRNKKQSVA